MENGRLMISVAMRVPTVGLFLHMPLERWVHPHAPHRMIDLTGLSSDEMVASVLAAV